VGKAVPLPVPQVTDAVEPLYQVGAERVLAGPRLASNADDAPGWSGHANFPRKGVPQQLSGPVPAERGGRQGGVSRRGTFRSVVSVAIHVPASLSQGPGTKRPLGPITLTGCPGR